MLGGVDDGVDERGDRNGRRNRADGVESGGVGVLGVGDDVQRPEERDGQQRDVDPEDG